MSAYNTLRVDEVCLNCENAIQRAIQFKYGDVWQRTYVQGDRLVWDGNNVGEPGHKRVLLLGYPEKCPRCAFQPDWTYDLVVEDDVVLDAVRREPKTEAERYPENSQYSVLEP